MTVASKQIPAVATCRARGWRAGTVLRSAKWHSDRTISMLDDVEVRLLIPRADKPEYRQPVYVKKLPEDVCEAID